MPPGMGRACAARVRQPAVCRKAAGRLYAAYRASSRFLAISRFRRPAHADDHHPRQTHPARQHPACRRQNSTLPLLAATLLCDGPRLRDGPRLADVDTSLALLDAVGGPGAALRGGPLHPSRGPPLRRHPGASGRGHAQLGILSRAAALPRRLCAPAAAGGCRLGPRPVDIHLAGLAAMGAEVELEGIAVTLRRTGPLHGVDFTLRLPSVGATMTLLMAACCAAGQTVLRGAAQEPEIGDMIAFLSACGADIQGAGTPVLTVQGGRPLGGAVHRPLPDRIAAATYAAALACAGGDTHYGLRPGQL